MNPNSKNTFVTKEATDLLTQYSTNEIAFVVVMANHQAGKSFFCDKILNLAEVKGNHVNYALFSFAETVMLAFIFGQHLSKKIIWRFF